VETIDANAFEGCTALTEANFPAVTNIGQYVFQNCTALTSLTLPAVPPWLGDNVFTGTFDTENTTSILVISVPSGAVDKYENGKAGEEYEHTPGESGWGVDDSEVGSNENGGEEDVYGTKHKAIRITDGTDELSDEGT
jgi:hypothetical protein